MTVFHLSAGLLMSFCFSVKRSSDFPLNSGCIPPLREKHCVKGWDKKQQTPRQLPCFQKKSGERIKKLQHFPPTLKSYIIHISRCIIVPLLSSLRFCWSLGCEYHQSGSLMSSSPPAHAHPHSGLLKSLETVHLPCLGGKTALRTSRLLMQRPPFIYLTVTRLRTWDGNCSLIDFPALRSNSERKGTKP